MDKALHIWVQLHAFPTQRAIENFLLALSNAFVIAAATNSASLLDRSDSATVMEQPRSTIYVWLESASVSTGWAPVLSCDVVEENVQGFREAIDFLFIQLSSAWNLTALTTDWTHVAHAIFSTSSSGRFVHSLVLSENLALLSHMASAQENFTISSLGVFSSYLAKSFSDRLLSFKSREEIQCWLLPYLSSTVTEVRFTLSMSTSAGTKSTECVARARAIHPTLLPIDLCPHQDGKPSTDWSSSEWDEEVVEIVSAISVSGICQGVLFGHQPLVVESAAAASASGCFFSALCRSLGRRGWALLARRARGGGRVVLLPAGHDRLVMQHVLTKELVLPLEGEVEACDTPLAMEKALESLGYADCYNPLQEDGQLVALLNQWIHEKKNGGHKQPSLGGNIQEKRKIEDQGLRAIKKYQLPIKIMKHQ